MDLTDKLPKEIRFLGLNLLQKVNYHVVVCCNDYAVKVVEKAKTIKIHCTDD